MGIASVMVNTRYTYHLLRLLLYLSILTSYYTGLYLSSIYLLLSTYLAYHALTTT